MRKKERKFKKVNENPWFPFLDVDSKLVHRNKFRYNKSNFVNGQYIRPRIDLESPFHKDNVSLNPPEIDGMKYMYWDDGEGVPFQTMLKKGYDSPLIRHFAECESSKLPYQDPETNTVLMNLKKHHKREEEHDDHLHYLYVNGGYHFIRRIWSIDQDFFKVLYRYSIDHSDFALIELHLAMDVNLDLMPYVTHNLQQGKYILNDVKAYVYGYVGETWYEGLWTKRGDKFKNFKELKMDLKTVYFGTSQKSSYSMIIYDKSHETLQRRGGYIPPTTRIEARIHRLNDAFFTDLAEASILHSLDTEDGVWYRSFWFLSLLDTIVKFTRIYDTRNTKASDLVDWCLSFIYDPLVSMDPFKYYSGASGFANPTYIVTEEPNKEKWLKPQGRKGRPLKNQQGFSPSDDIKMGFSKPRKKAQKRKI